MHIFWLLFRYSISIIPLSICVPIEDCLTLFHSTTYLLLLADESDTTKMVFTKAINSDEKNVVFFEILEPSTLRYIFKSKIARNFGTSFVSII